MNIKERTELAINPSTPPKVLGQLSHDPESSVRWWVVQHPSVPVDVLERLSADSNEVVRWEVAANPSTPTDTLIRMTSDEHAGVRFMAWEAIERRGLIGLLGDGG